MNTFNCKLSLNIRTASLFFSVLILILFDQPVGAQSLADILTRHFDVSGQDKLSSINTVRSTGRAVQMDNEFPFMQIQKRPDKMYLEIDINGIKIIQAFNGETGWLIEPQISSGPREMSAPELENLNQLSRIDSDLVNWKEKGFDLELIGRESHNGSDFFIIRLIQQDNSVYHFYIDAESYLTSRMVAFSDYNGEILRGETVLSDYRKIDGISVPFRTEVIYDGDLLMTTIVDKVEFDPVIENNYFSRP